MTQSRRRASLAVMGLFLILAAALVTARMDTNGNGTLSPLAKIAAGEVAEPSPGNSENGAVGREAADATAAQAQFDNARLSGGQVSPGAYSAAFANLTALPVSGGSWSEITRVPYDADDPDYRDWYSNSSGGSGLVTGRVTGLAADGNGYVYAASAVGGVWRSASNGGNWTPIADALPSLSSGDLKLAADGSLWYATGEANTGGTSYAGTGVYRLADARTSTFDAARDRVGGDELESTTINAIRFTATKAYVATLRGIWSHPLSDYSSRWTRVFAPQPQYLPGGSLAGVQNAAYQNIVNDLVIDPKNANHLLAAVGWRSGAAYNGFYESVDGGATWTKINPAGGIDATDIGNASFAYSGDGSTLYVMNQSPRMLNSFGTQGQSMLDGIYVSKNGLVGPWNRIASPGSLGATATGSALANNDGRGYGPGVQAWYNQFLAVDPGNPEHVYAGLEEVYETKDGGTHWDTVGPYWNFGFSCWNVDVLYPPNGDSGANGCPQSTHSDQHAIAFGTTNGKQYVFVGNDGGVYRRPLLGKENKSGHATDWVSLNDGTMDALQYYYVGVGKLNADDASRPDINTGDSVLVSGGLQDNGGSLVRPGAAKMVSNFGGDGGDVLVDPNDGCNIVHEYVYLSMRMTNTCANPKSTQAWLDFSQSTSWSIKPPDINAQFIAPFTANESNINQWLAGGNSLWYQDKGFAIKSGAEWQRVKTLASPAQTFTSVTFSGNKALATWCGPCSNSTAAVLKRGATVGTLTNGTWTWTDVSFAADFPNRWLSGAAIDPTNTNHMFISISSFSRRFTEGPGSGLGHVYESKDGGTTWSDASANIPDIPANDVVVTKSGGVIVATDLAVFYRAPGSTSWTRLGANLPVTVAMDLSVGPDGKVYVATHGRGIWRIATP